MHGGRISVLLHGSQGVGRRGAGVGQQMAPRKDWQGPQWRGPPWVWVMRLSDVGFPPREGRDPSRYGSGRRKFGEKMLRF